LMLIAVPPSCPLYASIALVPFGRLPPSAASIVRPSAGAFHGFDRPLTRTGAAVPVWRVPRLTWPNFRPSGG
jgi:hypothetical protein